MTEQNTPNPNHAGIPGAEDLQLIDASDLGKLIGRSTKSIRIDVTRRPETLPPRFVIPGTRKVRWRVADVRRWMEALAAVEEQRRVESARFARAHGAKDAPSRRTFHLGRRDVAQQVIGKVEAVE